MLPTLARLFAVPLDQLVGIEPLPAKRGPDKKAVKLLLEGVILKHQTRQMINNLSG